ncbi:MAG: sigma-70 family RNA polymerase sigma factor [Bacteroidales bacterium]|nr:sigma-70 family RNA polymerase sigma factor [Bacteroidales bacterium]
MPLSHRRIANKDDAQLVAALLQGDEAAVRYVFYDRYDLLLRHNAVKACRGCCIDFEDLRHELYLYLSIGNWARLRRYDSRQPFESWLSVVSYRCFRDYARRSCNLLLEPLPDGPDDGVSAQDYSSLPESVTIAGIDIRLAINAVDNDRDRHILSSLLIDDLPPAIVAASLGISIDNLYNAKRRALARLIRQSLNEYQSL